MSFLPRPTAKPGPGSLSFQSSRYGATPTFSSNEFLSSVAEGETGASGTKVDLSNSIGLRSNASREKGIQWDGDGARRRRLATLCCFGVPDDDVHEDNNCLRLGSGEVGDALGGDSDGDDERWGLGRLVLELLAGGDLIEEGSGGSSGGGPSDGALFSGVPNGVLGISCVACASGGGGGGDTSCSGVMSAGFVDEE